MRIKKSVISAVNGLSIGIGTIMLLHCDLVYVVDDVKFSFPFINLELSHEGGIGYRSD
ncbi:MAG: hypothetical protein JRC99_04605 [Deltaproteobacteria bacterium]|nr:hypothetical protein [Deltaproteobacteria bacterium]